MFIVKTKSKKSAKPRIKRTDTTGILMLKSVAKGMLAAIALTIAAILLFAFLLKAFSLEDTVIPPVNQIIKVASVILAAVIASKGTGGPAWLRGIIAGLAYILVGFLLFSLIEGSFGLVSVLLSDMLAGGVIGFAATLIFARLPKKVRN